MRGNRKDDYDEFAKLFRASDEVTPMTDMMWNYLLGRHPAPGRTVRVPQHEAPAPLGHVDLPLTVEDQRWLKAIGVAS